MILPPEFVKGLVEHLISNRGDFVYIDHFYEHVAIDKDSLTCIIDEYLDKIP